MKRDEAFERLESFGIKQQGAEVLQHSSMNQLDEGAFFDQATDVLRHIEGIVREGVMPNLADQYGRWHPSGFMVYPLGSHALLGGLRLHVWPRDLRQREIKGVGELDLDGCLYDGDIHNHAWHIASLVMNGDYRDNLYNVSESGYERSSLSPEEVALRGLYHIYRVSYRTETHPEALVTDGEYVAADLSEKRHIPEGDLHIIPAGPFHAPTIPSTELSSTLVFNSSRVMPGGPDILIAGTDRPIVGNRLDVSLDEAHEVSSQLR